MGLQLGYHRLLSQRPCGTPVARPPLWARRRVGATGPRLGPGSQGALGSALALGQAVTMSAGPAPRGPDVWPGGAGGEGANILRPRTESSHMPRSPRGHPHRGCGPSLRRTSAVGQHWDKALWESVVRPALRSTTRGIGAWHFPPLQTLPVTAVWYSFVCPSSEAHLSRKGPGWGCGRERAHGASPAPRRAGGGGALALLLPCKGPGAGGRGPAARALLLFMFWED